MVNNDQVCLGDLAVDGNFVCCLIIGVTLIGLGRAYRLGERSFEAIICGASHKVIGPFLWGTLIPQDTM